MATPPGPLQPPFYDPPIADYASGQQHSQAWTEYHQSISDQLNSLAGIGQYLETVGSPVPLADTILTQLASLDLTPGDWDVSGSVYFQAGSGVHTIFAAGINAIDSQISATMPTTPINQRLPTAQHRMNITSGTTVWVVGQAAFGGTCTATGTISARRWR